MVLGVDVDGVLADFNTSFIERIVAVTGVDLFPPRPFDIPLWHYPEHYGYSVKDMNNVWDSVRADPTFWVNLPPYPDTGKSLVYLSGLRRNHDIYFVTARVGVRCKLQTERWLRKHGFDDATVLITGHKGVIAGALGFGAYIDDNLVNVASMVEQRRPCQTYLLVRPWNRMGILAEGIIEVSAVVGFADSLLGVVPK